MKMETWRHGDGDMETWRHRHRDMETWRNGDMEIWRHGHGDIKRKKEAQAIFHNPEVYRLSIC
jgi:hypothetical protein